LKPFFSFSCCAAAALDYGSSTYKVSNVAVIGKGEKDAAGQKLKVDDARAALLSLLEPYRDLCSARKVGQSVCLPGPSFLFLAENCCRCIA
jgi:hypothetical protein